MKQTNKTSYELSYNRSITVTHEFLERLESLLQQKTGVENSEIVYQCAMSSGQIASYSSYEEMLNGCDNVLERRLRYIVIKAKSLEADKDVSFELHIGLCKSHILGASTTVKGNISGDYLLVEAVYDEIDHYIRRLYRSRAYDIFAKCSDVMRAVILFAVILAGSNLIVLIHNFIVKLQSANYITDVVINFLLFAVPSTIIMVIVSNLLGFVMSTDFKEDIFPRVRFRIAAYAVDIDRLSELASHVFWGIIIGVVVSVAGALLYDFLSCFYEFDNLMGIWY